jgi:hypothetical protein
MKYITFKVFDIDITYGDRPNDDIYVDTVPKEVEVTIWVQDDFKLLTLDDQLLMLKPVVIDELEDRVEFDTPDEPYFTISDVSFCFEEAD